MTMRITFEASTTGFDQVSRALEQQQKLLNENAEAAERLAKAQAGIGRSSAPGSQDALNYFKETSKTIKDVTGALQQLNQTQSGLQSFMSLFSGFRRELNEAAADQKTGVFQVLSTQVDTLKKNMTASALSIRSIKDEVKDLEKAVAADPRNPNLRSQLADARGFLSLEQQGLSRDSYLYNQARLIQLANQPIGSTLAGLFGGGGMGGGGGPLGFLSGIGPSPTSVMRRAAITGIGLYAANRAGEFISNVGAADDIARIANYRYEMGIAQEAMQGNIGEAFMRSRGIGKFDAMSGLNRGDIPLGIFNGGANNAMATAFRMGDGFAETFGNMFSVFKTQARAMITEFRFATGDEFARILGQRAASLSQDQIDALNKTSSIARENLLSPEFRRMEAQFGYSATRNMQGRLAAQGISLSEASPALEAAAAAGLSRSSLITMNPALLMNAGQLGISDRTRSELFRRAAYGRDDVTGIRTQTANLESFLGAAQGMGIDVRGNFAARQQITDYISGIQSQFGVPMSEQQVGGRFMSALQQTGVSQLGMADRIRAAADVDSIAKARISNPRTIESMGINAALMRYGISEYGRAIIMEQMSAGNTNGAVQAIARLTGKDPDEVKNEINKISQGTQAFRRSITGADTERGKREDAIFQSLNMGNRMTLFETGTSMSVLSAQGAYDQEKGISLLGGDLTTGTRIPLGDQGTQGRNLMAQQQTANENVLKQFEQVAVGAGSTVAGLLGETFKVYTNEIEKELNKIKIDLASKSQNTGQQGTTSSAQMSNPSLPKGPVTGPNQRGD